MKARIVLCCAVFFVFACAAPPPSLIIHYFRYNGDYEGWNVWAWPVDPSGEGQTFLFDTDKHADGFVTARIFWNNFPSGGEIGMILKKSENGNEWAEKDGNNDRFTDKKEVWLVQNDSAVYTEKPDVSKPPILFAVADSAGEVQISMVQEPADYGVFAVYEGDKKLDGFSEAAETDAGQFRAVVSLREKIGDPSKKYTVRDESGLFAERQILMRGILDAFYYDGNDLGLTYGAEESLFKVWAPSASAAALALYDDAGTYNAAGKVTDQETANLHPMKKDPQTGVWSVVIRGNLEGKLYLYRAEFADGTVNWAADPYAAAVTANGQRMAIVNLAAANPPGWKPNSKPPFGGNPRSPAWQDAVIYELHVRDFSIDENSGMKHKGKFLAFTERGTKNGEGFSTGVDHLVKLGITHVHLLPAFDFASVNELTVDDPASTEAKFNWGYDPQNYNVPEGSYSTDPKNPVTRITEFKRMVQSLHDAGIRVIMDVVFNHTFQSGAGPFDSLVPAYYYRTTGTGAYANGSACGNEVASERPMVRKFIVDSCLYWAREYNVDGFRFDLMGLIDTPTMKQLTDDVRRIVDPTILVYGEPWQAGGSILPENLQTGIGSQKGLDFAIFNDRIRTAIKGGSDDSSRGFATGRPSMEQGIVRGLMGSVHDFTAQANESVNYVTAHDNLNLWDKIALSLGEKDLARSPYGLLSGKKDLFEHNAVKSVLLANGVVFTSQGIPFFQAGDEMLRSKFGDHNSYTSSDEINKIRWENAGKYQAVVAYYAGLIRLRREHPAFRQSVKTDIEKSIAILDAKNHAVSFIITDAGDSWRRIFVAYNGGGASKQFSLPQAEWYQVVDAKRAGTETLARVSAAVTLPPFSLAVLHD